MIATTLNTLISMETAATGTLEDLFDDGQFDLDVRVERVDELPEGVGRSANCTNNGCTRSCVSCGCR